jgi:hypothetical protein
MNTVELVKDETYVFNFESERGRMFDILLRGPFAAPVTGIYSEHLDAEDRFGWRVSLDLNDSPMLPGSETFAGADTLSIEITDTIRELSIMNPYTAFDMNINGNPISRIHSDYFEFVPAMLILPTTVTLEDDTSITLQEAINRQIFSFSSYFAVADAFESDGKVFIQYNSEDEHTEIEYDADIGVLNSFFSEYTDQYGNLFELSLELRAVGISINTEVQSSSLQPSDTEEEALFTLPFPTLNMLLMVVAIPILRRIKR